MPAEHYNRPHLLHLAHIQARVEAPVVKEGSGKELWHLHDICSQYLWALKVIQCKLSGLSSFI